MSATNIYMQLNGVAPNHAAYTYGGSNFAGGIITIAGSALEGDFTGMLRRLSSSEIRCCGSGIRGQDNGNAFVNMVWKNVNEDEEIGLTFSQAGKLYYRKV